MRSACSYCGVGCGMVLDVAVDPDSGRRRVVKVRGDKEHPTNRGRLCTKGATSADMLSAGGRVETAMARPERGAPLEPRPTDETIAETGGRLRAVIDEHGPDAVALYVSGQMSLEAQYLANKLAKGFIGTNNIESNSRLCMASAGTGYKLSLGSDAPPGSYDDFDHADVFFVIGSNMADTHPILFLRMMDRVKAGAKLIVVDPRRTATADKADLYLPIAPGTDLALMNGLLRLLHDDGALDEEFIAASTEGWERMPELLADYPVHAVAELTGLSEDDLRTAARWIGEAGAWMSCWTMGLNQSTHGTWNTNAIINLHLATGAICRPGAGPFSLTGQPNAMGGREMGYMGPGLPGQRSVVSAEDRAFVENVWGLPEGAIDTRVGGGTVEMFEKMADGDIRAAWIICTNPVASVANRGTVIRGLEACELVVTQDVFVETETNAYADVLLPAALWAESTSVSVNSERTLTLLNQAADPVGDSMPDWQIIAGVATAMGFGDAFSYASAAEVFEEIRAFSNPKTGYDLRGVDYGRLARTPVQWPSPPESGDGDGRHPIRYVNDGTSSPLRTRDDGTVPPLAFATESGRAVFHPRPHMPAKEMPDDDFPFVLNTGRLPHHWHTMTKTGKVAKLNALNPKPFVEIHPDDAARLGVADGDAVEIASRRGRAVLPAAVSDRVQRGALFAPFHWNDVYGEYLAVNAVTNDAVDPLSFQPEFKIAAVAVTKASVPVSLEVEPAAEPTSPDPAHDAGEPAPAITGLGLQPVPPPTLTPEQSAFLQGFLWAHEQEGGGVATLPESAPFTSTDRAWLNGMLARRTATTATAAETRERVMLLWASQTGTAEDHAVQIAERLRTDGHDVDLVCMDDTSLQQIAERPVVLVVSSTFGDGDAPDNGDAFWRELSAEAAPRMPGVRFAVLAFGDPSYSAFCGHGRRVDERLAELGAERLVPRVDCDPDADKAPTRWYESVARAIGTDAAPAATVADRPPLASPTATRYSRSSPLVTRLTRNERLSATASSKDVRRFSLAVDDELTYRAGDALGVRPVNSDHAVDAWLSATGLDGDAAVDLDGVGTLALREAATRHLEIVNVGRPFLRFVGERTRDRQLATLLREGNTLNLDKWLWGRQAVDVLAELPVSASADEWLGVLGRLQPRLYSISSSPLVSPHEVELTVSAVRFEHQGRPRRGVCSTFLADHGDGADVPVFVQQTKHFRPPEDPTAPMIMIGPGTGIAPFRGFLQERRALGHAGRNWLFFGERDSATDFYYRDELESWQRDGLLTKLSLAFSREQRQKVYVQDRLREQGSHVWSWLEDGGHVYVCGDATRMASDVHRALVEVARTWGGLDEDDATEYFARMAREKRYVRDVY
ncbi:MAG: reductase [Microbacterium sp.]|nr:reductase [Planctomycetota bacterium]MAM55602.1 reductase [Microbacterium sp.]